MLTIKNAEELNTKFFLNTIFSLSFLFLCRIISMCFIPLNDITEARYAEIARKMLETGNWVTLQHDYGVPFWAKPPLSTWLSALSMDFFGINEFAVRLPGLFLSIAILGLIWNFSKKHSGFIVARIAVLVLAGTSFFYLDAGTVMTDPSLLFCTTLSMVAFWHAFYGNKFWGHVFFISIGLGLLAKGPIALVLVGMPIFFWVLLRSGWGALWNHLPWFKGIIITAAIALPWYILAEIRTPGFLSYFIVGEHINRFLIPGWTGDKYGLAHNQARGMIWIYALVGIFPWSILCFYWLRKNWKKFFSVLQDDDGWMLYLLLCMAVPLIFFTFSSNIIYTYVFPSLPAFALFFAEIWNRSNLSFKSLNWIVCLSLLCGTVFLIATLLFNLKPELIAKTQKSVVLAWIMQKPPQGSSLIYWDNKTDFSAQFYASGRVKFANDLDTLRSMLLNTLENYLVVNARDINQIPANLLSQCNEVKAVQYKEKKTILFHCPELNMIA